MTYRTLAGVLHPDGRVSLPDEDLPDHPVQVMVTLLEPDEATSLAQPGDYLQQLSDYEERLARGDIRWQ
jgi:hypothetical protein